jgi:NitT/TauT family transport system ATP-binding protein
MIEIKGLTKSYGDKTVFENLSFSFCKGSRAVLTGPSGAGKTTLLRVIAGLEAPDAGTVSGTENLRASYIFQENRLLPHLSALENILCVAPDREKALYYLERVGLTDAKDRPAGKLSGGMKRRLAIARALTYGGDIYYMDEPLRELDEGTEENVARLLQEETQGRTLLLVTHDLAFAGEIGDVIFRFAGEPMHLLTDS